MVIVKIQGGLGNQMFQYAFYEYLRKYTRDIKFDLSRYDRAMQHNGYELNKIFGIDVPAADEDEVKAMKADFWHLLPKVKRRVFGTPKSVFLQETAWSFDGKLFRDNTYYSGYWMNYRYFDDKRRLIKQKFTFAGEISEQNQKVIKKMAECQSVAVHIRRGDYLEDAKYGSVCERDYYEEAIRSVNRAVASPYYFFFSDDAEWVRENFRMENSMVIDWNTGKDSYLDMMLMSRAKHNIIANSTFSWWGAYLNANKDKVVIGPRYWFADEKRDRREQMAEAVMLPAWIRI